VGAALAVGVHGYGIRFPGSRRRDWRLPTDRCFRERAPERKFCFGFTGPCQKHRLGGVHEAHSILEVRAYSFAWIGDLASIELRETTYETIRSPSEFEI
jgi:hypothetical protein